VVIIVLLSFLPRQPAAQAAGAPGPSWQAWAISVDFPSQKPHVVYTAYVGTNTPTPQVLTSSTVDISKKCTIVSPTGNLNFDGTSAIFDGQSYIQCQVPSWRTKLAALAPTLPGANNNTLMCDAGGGPLFSAASVKLDAVSATNPVIDARDLGSVFSLPSDGIRAQTQLALSSRTYLSPRWNLDLTAGNRMVMGMNGPAIVAASNYFGWLTFLTPGLTPAWDAYFTGTVVGTQMGHYVESPAATWTTTGSSYRLRTTGSTVYIGHDSMTGANLHGKVSIIRHDPGCFGS